MKPNIEKQIARLAGKYGAPLRITATLNNTNYEPLTSTDRYGEICMVLRRKNGKFLTATKSFYPPNAHRLLTGGIHLGEKIEDALWREVDEETNLKVDVARFLAVITYAGSPFLTFAFLLDERKGKLKVNDPKEKLTDFYELTLEELAERATVLDNLDGVDTDNGIGAWRDWGQFRAVVHRAVYQSLSDEH